MNLKMKLFGGFAVGGAILASAFGSAASLTVDGGTIQAGSDGSLACDPDGVYVDSYIVNDTSYGPGWGAEGVMGLRIKGVDSTCHNARLYARVDDASGNALAFTTPTWGTCGVGNWAIALSAEPSGGYVLGLVQDARTVHTVVAPEDIARVKIWLEGYETTPCVAAP